MKMVIDDDEVSEILIEDVVKSNDLGKVIIKGEFTGKREKERSIVEKEIIALDTITLGASRAAEIHNIPQSSASKYGDGLDMKKDEDARARVLSIKHNIADIATTKLLDTLGLINPMNFASEKDKVAAASQLANVVEKISPRDDRSGGEVHLHLHAPKMKEIKDYRVIDV